MLRDAVFVFHLNQPSAGSVFSHVLWSWVSLHFLSSLTQWIFSRDLFQYGLQQCRLALGIDSFAAVRTAVLKLEAFLLILCLEKVIDLV